jgi:hypothetical protein
VTASCSPSIISCPSHQVGVVSLVVLAVVLLGPLRDRPERPVALDLPARLRDRALPERVSCWWCRRSRRSRSWPPFAPTQSELPFQLGAARGPSRCSCGWRSGRCGGSPARSVDAPGAIGRAPRLQGARRQVLVGASGRPEHSVRIGPPPGSGWSTYPHPSTARKSRHRTARVLDTPGTPNVAWGALRHLLLHRTRPGAAPRGGVLNATERSRRSSRARIDPVSWSARCPRSPTRPSGRTR